MARLIETTPCAGLLPMTIGTVGLSEVDLGPVFSVAPFKGQAKAVDAALKDVIGAGFPKPGKQVTKEGVRVLWSGAGQALVIGARPEGLEELAAVTDQSDASATVRIDGADAEAVLARLVPIDLRRTVFPRNSTARTMLAHLTVSVTRVDADAFEIMTMRSMAGTLVDDLSEAAEGVAARARIPG